MIHAKAWCLMGCLSLVKGHRTRVEGCLRLCQLAVAAAAPWLTTTQQHRQKRKKGKSINVQRPACTPPAAVKRERPVLQSAAAACIIQSGVHCRGWCWA